MKKTLLRASLIAMLSFVACGNDFMNVMASEEVSADVIFAQRAEDKQAVKSIVDKMQEHIRSDRYGHYSDAVKLMSNYVHAKGDSLEALFPSVLKDLGLGNPSDDKAKYHVAELLRALGVLIFQISFDGIAEDELLAIATDDIDAYQAVTAVGYKFTLQRALAAALAGSVKVFKFMVANPELLGCDSDLFNDASDLFNAALVGGNSELVYLCQNIKADENWSFDCFGGEGFIKDNLFQWLITHYEGLDKEVANSFLLTVSNCGRLNFVKYLVEKCYADVNTKNWYSETPIYIASSKGHLEVVKYLHEQCHAKVEAKDKRDQTAIHYASKHGHLDVVKYLHEKGANVEAKDSNDETPIHRASSKGHLELVKYLHEKGAKVEAKNKRDQTAIHYASENGNLELVKYLVEQCHADVEAKNNDGYTPLIVASLWGNLDVVKYLVEECHAAVEAKNNLGNTPLIGASLGRHLDVVKYLHEECHAEITDEAISKARTDEIKDYLRSKKTEQDAQK